MKYSYSNGANLRYKPGALVLGAMAALFALASSVMMIVGAQAAHTEVVVSGDTAPSYDEPGWLFNRDTSTSSPYEFNNDQTSIGNGSLYVLPVGPDAADKFIGELFVQQTVDDVSSISYDYRLGTSVDSSKANEFYANVYVNETDNGNYYDCKYDVVPSDGTAGWHTNTFDTTASYPVTTGGGATETCPASPSDLPSTAVIRMFAINLGDTSTSDVGVDGYFDNVVVNSTDTPYIYDFEPLGQVEGMTILADGDDLGCYPVINERGITVDWDDVDGAVAYNYQADADMAVPYDFTTQVTGSERSGMIRDQDGTYNYRVQAVNSNGEVGEWSEWCGVTLDREAPVVEITSPADNSDVSDMVNVYGTVLDDNLSHYNASLYPASADLSDGQTHSSERISDSGVVSTDEFTNEVVLSFDSTTIADGEYQVRLAARDLAGNRDTSNTETGGDSSVHVITLTVDNRPDNKNECKNGGWTMGLSLERDFRNQGDCVSHFASDNQAQNNPDGNRGRSNR